PVEDGAYSLGLVHRPYISRHVPCLLSRATSLRSTEGQGLAGERAEGERRHEADRAPDVAALAPDSEPVDGPAAAGGPPLRAERADGGRRAGAGRAREAEALARCDGEADVLDRVDLAEAPGQATDLDHGHRPAPREAEDAAPARGAGVEAPR